MPKRGRKKVFRFAERVFKKNGKAETFPYYFLGGLGDLGASPMKPISQLEVGVRTVKRVTYLGAAIK